MTTQAVDQLRWNEPMGMGYLPAPVSDDQYAYEYWAKYHEYKKSPIAEKLMRARVMLVEKHTPGARIVDIGIGSGHFIEKRDEATDLKTTTYGYDVNPHAVRWLIERGLWWDPWAKDPDVVTCWDSLEHLPRPHDFLARVRKTVFVSLPIFRDREHVLVSKHFKPGEHLWYFTRNGLLRYMMRLGFVMIDTNEMESALGREEIGTFVFTRRAAIPS